MKTQQDQENASPVIQQKGNKQESAFKDERSETVAQGKLYDMVNNSEQVTQMQSLQSMVDNRVQNSPFDPIQRKENNTGLPDNLKSGVENLSGHSMDDVKVHYNSPKPAQLQAHAYAQGTDIHVASGQEKHLPHEAWHVVQQKQGRVKPTMQMKGKVNVNDDSGLEREADVMGAKALQLKTNNESNKSTSIVRSESNVAQLRYNPFKRKKKEGESPKGKSKNKEKSKWSLFGKKEKEKEEEREWVMNPAIEAAAVASNKEAVRNDIESGTQKGKLKETVVPADQSLLWAQGEYNREAVRNDIESGTQKGKLKETVVPADQSLLWAQKEYIEQAKKNGPKRRDARLIFGNEDGDADAIKSTLAGMETKEGLESSTNHDDASAFDTFQGVWGGVEEITGNLTDDFGNGNFTEGENDFIGEMGIGDGLAPESAALGGVLAGISAYKNFKNKDSTAGDKAEAVFGMGAGGATAFNKTALATGSTDYATSTLATSTQLGGATAGAMAGIANFGNSGIKTYRDAKEGNKIDAGIGALKTLKSGTSAANEGIKVGHGATQVIKNGVDIGEAGVAGTAVAGTTQVLGIASAGLGVAVGAAQVGKGIYDYKEAGKLKTNLNEMKGEDGIDTEVMDTLVKGQNDKQARAGMTMAEGGIGILGGVLAILASTGVLAAPAALIGTIAAIGFGLYKLGKYIQKTRKQKKIDVPINTFLETNTGTDYSAFLKGDGIIDYSDYKAKRIADAKKGIEDAKTAKKDAKDAKEKQKGKNKFKSFFTKDKTKDAQKKVEAAEQKYGQYSNMSDDEIEAQIVGLRGDYDQSTYAKKEKAYEQAQKALKMLQEVSGENKTKILEALGVKEQDLNETKDKGASEARDTTEAEKTKMLAEELMRMLSV
jgi:hypothetical protein